MNISTRNSMGYDKKALWTALIGAAAIAILSAFSLMFGAANVGAPAAGMEKADIILTYIRLPRTIACLLSGGALAVAGLLLQTTLNNRLASPGIVGVNSGAGLFVILAAILFPAIPFVKYFAALIGALATVLLIYAIAKRTGAARVTILLAGVAAGSLLSAASDAAITLFPDAVFDKTAFFIGGFASVSIQGITLAWPFIVCGLLGALLMGRRLDVLALGDEVAHSLGMRVEGCRFLAILAVASLAAGAVSIAGLIGFVGLIVPNLVRMMIPSGHRTQILLSALLGAALVLGCDIVARLAFAPFELPVGILLSAIGAPFFLAILFRKKWCRSYD